MEGNKVVSQSILNGVIFIGLYILFISGIPLLNMLALVAMPLPIVYITAVYGLKPGIVLSSSAGIMTALLSALLTGLFFFYHSVLLPLVLLLGIINSRKNLLLSV